MIYPEFCKSNLLQIKLASGTEFSQELHSFVFGGVYTKQTNKKTHQSCMQMESFILANVKIVWLLDMQLHS